MTQDINISDATEVELNQFEHPAWDEPIICRVEVDLPGWLAQLTGKPHWEVFSEDEEETCISFTMRLQEKTIGRVQDKTTGLTHSKLHNHGKPQISAATQAPTTQAEVTLYHNGYAVVDVDGKALFDGSLTTATSNCARLSYYHVNGEPIALN